MNCVLIIVTDPKAQKLRSQKLLDLNIALKIGHRFYGFLTGEYSLNHEEIKKVCIAAYQELVENPDRYNQWGDYTTFKKNLGELVLDLYEFNKDCKIKRSFFS